MVERRLFLSRYRKVEMLLEIYQGTERGQLLSRIFTNGPLVWAVSVAEQMEAVSRKAESG